MVKLDAGVSHDKQAWETCNSVQECANPVKNDWAPADVFTVVTDDFKKKAGDAMVYLDKRGWSNATVNGLLAWMNDKQANGNDAAMHFLRTQPEVWKAWVSEDVAAKVQASL